MQNLKIRVNNEAESKEAQELFFELGATLGNGDRHAVMVTGAIGLVVIDGLINFVFNQVVHSDIAQAKEITLPELRAMVNPMKEYLDANRNYEFVLSTEKDDGFIEIPEGAVKFIFSKENAGNYHFTNESDQLMSLADIHYGKPFWYGNAKNYMNQCKVDVLWQREQDEPFLTPETTLNDQYAEIEKVRQVEIHGTVKAEPDLNFGAAQASGGVDATLAERQSTYGCFEDVAFVTENIMSILAKVRPDGLQDFPYAHRMALYMIASKMARIVNGDFNHLDSWHDIGGYSKLIEKLIKGE